MKGLKLPLLGLACLATLGWARDVSAQVSVVIETGYYTPDNVSRILDAGAEACLAKPIDTEAMMALILPRQSAAGEALRESR